MYAVYLFSNLVFFSIRMGLLANWKLTTSAVNSVMTENVGSREPKHLVQNDRKVFNRVGKHLCVSGKLLAYEYL